MCVFISCLKTTKTSHVMLSRSFLELFVLHGALSVFVDRLNSCGPVAQYHAQTLPALGYSSFVEYTAMYLMISALPFH